MLSSLAYWRLYVVAFLIVLLDQATKLWILHHVPEGSYHPPAFAIIEGFLYIVHIYNEGAAWGMFQGYGMALAILGIATLIALYFFRKSLELHDKVNQILFGLIIGGIVGNLIDRLLYGHVIDFIDVHLPGYRWPSFNIADSGITIGVVLYILLGFFQKPAKQDKEPSQAPTETH